MAGFGRRESSHPINSSPDNLNGVVVLQDAVSSIRVEAGEGWTEVLCLAIALCAPSARAVIMAGPGKI